jgi:hypothetical protein
MSYEYSLDTIRAAISEIAAVASKLDASEVPESHQDTLRDALNDLGSARTRLHNIGVVITAELRRQSGKCLAAVDGERCQRRAGHTGHCSANPLLAHLADTT